MESEEEKSHSDGLCFPCLLSGLTVFAAIATLVWYFFRQTGS